jgi:hypothetical protein
MLRPLDKIVTHTDPEDNITIHVIPNPVGWRETKYTRNRGWCERIPRDDMIASWDPGVTIVHRLIARRFSR